MPIPKMLPFPAAATKLREHLGRSGRPGQRHLVDHTEQYVQFLQRHVDGDIPRRCFLCLAQSKRVGADGQERYPEFGDGDANLVAGRYHGDRRAPEFRPVCRAAASVGPANRPSNLTATPASSSQVNLAWTDNSNNEDGFEIHRCQGARTSPWLRPSPPASSAMATPVCRGTPSIATKCGRTTAAARLRSRTLPRPRLRRRPGPRRRRRT
jgi:hypothetical protein